MKFLAAAVAATLLGSAFAQAQQFGAEPGPADQATPPSSPAPSETPPLPPEQLPPPPQQQVQPAPQEAQQPAPEVAEPAPEAAQPDAQGQWVYTQQYGWVWMPYGDQYTYTPTDAGIYPSEYVYYPSYGWTWVTAPWVFGWGVSPYFGVYGHARFGWYGRLTARGWRGYNGAYGYRPVYARPRYGGYGRPAYGGYGRPRYAAPRGAYAAPARAPMGGFVGRPVQPRPSGGQIGGFHGAPVRSFGGTAHVGGLGGGGHVGGFGGGFHGGGGGFHGGGGGFHGGGGHGHR